MAVSQMVARHASDGDQCVAIADDVREDHPAQELEAGRFQGAAIGREQVADRLVEASDENVEAVALDLEKQTDRLR